MKLQNIILRKIPYPYHAALALCSDLDNTPSLNIYLAIMDYLNGDFETPLGKGLGLEVGNSFWFFNMTSSPQLSYFKVDGIIETDFAPHCRNFWKSGHIDVLHTYGNYDEGGFLRRHADICLQELTKQNVNIKVWVNHGTPNNTQNLGFFESFNGAKPDKEEYHNDLLNAYGVRYAWMGRMTHILGQDAYQTINVKVKNILQRIMFNTKYRRYKNILYDDQNRLLIEAKLQDGNKIWEFQRWVNAWGREETLDINDLSNQLNPSNMNSLIKNEGFLIVYTHICENLYSEKSFPEKLKRNLENISKLYREGFLLVTTTSRLLQYSEVSHFMTFKTIFKNGLTYIIISPILNSLSEKIQLSKSALQGLTFYCQNPDKIRIIFKDENIKVKNNPIDHTGRHSIYIPWNALEYPRK